MSAKSRSTPELAGLALEFDRLLDMDPPVRTAHLSRIAAADPDLATALQRLWQHHEASDHALEQAAAATLSAILLPESKPASIGSYRLGEELGRGGMGIVYAAEDLDRPGHPLALKLLQRAPQDAAARERFQREVDSLRRCVHPGICRWLDSGLTQNGVPFVVMERVEGVSIRTWCDARQLDIPARLRLLIEAAQAIAHAHANLILHRDLKPENVMIDRHGKVKLLDFGIARWLDESSHATATQDRRLTPAYAAPEQHLGGPMTVAVDIYGFGALMYELLSGALPVDVEGCSAAEAERRVRDSVPPSLRARAAQAGPALAHARGYASTAELLRRLDRDLEAIVQGCLRKEPGERYASMAALIDDLQAYLAQRPVRARGGATTYRVWRFLQRHRLVVSLGAALLALLVGFAVNTALQARALAAERDRAQAALRVLRDAFLAADPGQTAGATVTARDILRAATPRLDSEFAAHPLLHAELNQMLAEVHLAIGQPGEARIRIDRAIDAVRPMPEAAAMLPDLERLQVETRLDGSDLAAAGILLDQHAERVRLDPAWALLRGRWHNQMLQPEQAIAVLQPMLAQTAAADAHDRRATGLRWQLADAWRLSGRYDEALRILDQCIAWQARSLPAEHPSLALTRLRRIDLLLRLERTNEALTQAQSLDLEIRAWYGEDNTLAARASNSLALALKHAGQVEASIAEQRRSLQLWLRSTGPSHINTLRVRINLAQALREQDPQSSTAGAMLDEALRDALAGLGAKHDTTMAIRLFLAQSLLDRAEHQAALKLLEEPEGRLIAQQGNRSNARRYASLLSTARCAAGQECTVSREVWPTPATDSASTSTAQRAPSQGP